MNGSKIPLTTKNNKPWRILYTQKPTGGGSTISLYELVKGLDTHRYEPVILFLQKNKYTESFNKLGIKTLTIDISDSEKRRKRRINSFLGKIYQLVIVDIPLGIRIFRILKKEKIDLVHLNLGFHRPVMIAASIAKTPKVFHFRNFNKNIPVLLKLLTSSIDAALYTTQAIANCYINLGITVTRSDVVYEPIDIQRFSKHQDTSYIKQEFSIKDSDYIVSNIGRITPWKGQYYFLQAMDDIVKQYPNTKVLIVGEPGDTSKDKKYLQLLEDISQKDILKEHVFLTGKRDDIAEIMSISDIVVHSASEPEPFGLVIAEAMATGKPVIATRGGGPIEIIKDGVTGLLVSMKSSAAIKEAIQKLLESKVLRENISIKAHQDVAQRFSIERHVDKVQKIYEDIFNKKI